MEDEYWFPKELLEMHVDERVKYFKNYTVAHHNLKEATKQLLAAINNAEDNSIILVYGPTGVGKTRLFLGTAKSIIEKSLPTLANNPGHIPIAGMEAVAPDNGNFNWIDHYIRCLKSIDEPLINYKIDVGNKTERINNANDTKVMDKAAKVLRQAFENALRNRKPLAYMIDEAQHLTKISSGKKLHSQMDTIKSLASLSKVPHVLFGTYELLPFRNLSGQLIRRSDDIHLPRYFTEKEGDMDHFIQALWAFQKHLPLEKEPPLVENYEFFYQRSIGCIGILKRWLLKCYKFILEKGEKNLTMDICKSFALTVNQCIHLINEAKNGEDLLKEDNEDQESLVKLLGEIVEKPVKTKTLKSKSKKTLPGVRNPTRDKVGDLENVQ